MRCDCCPACCAAHAQGQCPQDAPVYNAPIALYSGITLTFLHYIDMDLATLPALPADALALHFCLSPKRCARCCAPSLICQLRCCPPPIN